MRIAVVSQARMTSTRLPGKVLKEVGGRPLLEHHVDRIRGHGLDVIVATTTNAEDDPIVSLCERKGTGCFRGDEHDVLARYHGAAEAHDLDIVVRVTSDCPLIDGARIRTGVEKYRDEAGPYDYLGTGVPEKTYPLGFSFEVFSAELLRDAHRNADMPQMREHVTPYMKLRKNPRTRLIGIPLEQDWSGYRVTVDTEEDLELVRRLIEDHGADGMSMEEIVSLLQRHPELRALNDEVRQKKWHE